MPLAFALSTFPSLTGGKLKIALQNTLLLNEPLKFFPEKILTGLELKASLFVCLCVSLPRDENHSKQNRVPFNSAR